MTTAHLTADSALAALPAELKAVARRLLRSGSIAASGCTHDGSPLYSISLLRTAATVTTEEARHAQQGEHRVAVAAPATASRSPSGPTAGAGVVNLAFARS